MSKTWRRFTICMARSDSAHSIIIQHRRVMGLASNLFRLRSPNGVGAIGRTPFIYHVGHVFLLRSRKQVIWANTTAIVAFVANVQAIWNRTKSQLIANSVSQQIAAFALNKAIELSITCGQQWTLPFPATIAINFLNLTPKPFLHRFSGKFLGFRVTRTTTILAHALRHTFGTGQKWCAAVVANGLNECAVTWLLWRGGHNHKFIATALLTAWGGQ